MTSVAHERPKPFIAGLVPTLNHRGFMSESLDAFSARFVEYAATSRSPVLDMGCAYGVATRAALEQGACVHACDMEPGHLEILAAETPPELAARLTTSVGVLPGVDFADAAFGVILCSRVLHFLLGPEIRTTLAKMHRWLQPGGRLVLVADTPYSGFWSAGAPAYERRKAAGEEWPGLIEDIAVFFKDGRRPAGMLPHLNPLDPDLLRRECERAGLVVEEAAFTGRAGEPAARHHAGAIARRPADPR
jgi:SAM-dependent methyltransferase